jgi:hypothetical protein
MKNGTQIMLTLLAAPDGMTQDEIFDALVAKYQRSPEWESRMYCLETLESMVRYGWVIDHRTDRYTISQISLVNLLENADYNDFVEYPHFEC